MQVHLLQYAQAMLSLLPLFSQSQGQPSRPWLPLHGQCPIQGFGPVSKLVLCSHHQADCCCCCFPEVMEEPIQIPQSEHKEDVSTWRNLSAKQCCQGYFSLPNVDALTALCCQTLDEWHQFVYLLSGWLAKRCFI